MKFEEEEEVDTDEKKPTLLKSEILSAISEMKGKAVGVDDIPAEILKILGENALREICEICRHL